MLSRQGDKLIALHNKERVATDQECTCAILHKADKGGLNAAFIACAQDQQFDAKHASRSLCFARNDGAVSWARWIDEEPNQFSSRHKFLKQLETLCVHLNVELVIPVRLHSAPSPPRGWLDKKWLTAVPNAALNTRIFDVFGRFLFKETETRARSKHRLEGVVAR
jgi:hypothetical protein